MIGCVGEQTKRHPASCVINPASGKELEMKLIPADKKKHVAVAGGGIAGMAAARVLALRGHTVTLFEKTDRLGGQDVYKRQPYDIFRLCSFRRMAKTLEKGLKCMTFFSCILYVLVLWKMLFLKRCICRRDTLKQE